MERENQSRVWVGCISAAAIIIAAIIALGMPFAENMAARYFPPFTPTIISIPQTVVSPAPALSPSIIPQPISPSQSQPTTFTYCYGHCWQYDDTKRTMTWTRLADGSEDVWQPAGDALRKIRSGFTATFTTTVPGEIYSCVLSVNGETIKSSCDNVLYQLSPGTYQVTSANNSIGGFRWCPSIGQGYRIDGGECK